MWVPQHLTTLWASTACYRDSFTFIYLQYILIYCLLITDQKTNIQIQIGSPKKNKYVIFYKTVCKGPLIMKIQINKIGLDNVTPVAKTSPNWSQTLMANVSCEPLEGRSWHSTLQNGGSHETWIVAHNYALRIWTFPFITHKQIQSLITVLWRSTFIHHPILTYPPVSNNSLSSDRSKRTHMKEQQ
jgi:hypothetical protein